MGNSALVVLDTSDMTSFQTAVGLVREHGGEVLLAYPANAFIATLDSNLERVVSRHPTVRVLERGTVNSKALTDLGLQSATAAHVWNTVFRGVPDAAITAAKLGAPPERGGPDFLITHAQEVRVEAYLAACA